MTRLDSVVSLVFVRTLLPLEYFASLVSWLGLSLCRSSLVVAKASFSCPRPLPLKIALPLRVGFPETFQFFLEVFLPL